MLALFEYRIINLSKEFLMQLVGIVKEETTVTFDKQSILETILNVLDKCKKEKGYLDKIRILNFNIIYVFKYGHTSMLLKQPTNIAFTYSIIRSQLFQIVNFQEML